MIDRRQRRALAARQGRGRRAGVVGAALLVLGAWLVERVQRRSSGRATERLTARVPAAAELEPAGPGPVPAEPERRARTSAPRRPSATGAVRGPSSAGARLAGVVLDAGGGVIPGARVSANASGTQTSLGVASSDDEGRFELDVPMGWVDVVANAQAYSLGWTRVRAPAGELRLVLAPAASLLGRMVDAGSGTPIAGALIVATNVDGLRAPARSVRTDEDGSFEFEQLPGGGYSLLARSAEWRGMAPWVSVAVGLTTGPILIAAARSVTIDASVDVTGEPCAGGFIQLTGPAPGVEPIAADGSVHVQGLLPGRYEIRISCLRAPASPEGAALFTSEAPGNEPVEGQEMIEVSDQPVRRAWHLDEPPQLAIEEHDRGTIEVVVEGGGGAFTPLVQDQEATEIFGHTRGDAFEFAALAMGPYEVSLREAPDVRKRVALSAQGEVVAVRLAAPAAAVISGRVVDDAGRPLPDVWVSARASYGKPAGAPVLTDDAGTFTLEGLYSAVYGIDADGASGRAHADAVPAPSHGVLLRVKAYAALSGVVENAAGERAESFELSYRLQGMSAVRSLQGLGGEWNLAALAPGTYQLRVSSRVGNGYAQVALAPGSDAHVRIEVDSAQPDRLSELLTQ